jgi:cell division protein ZapE
VLHIEHRELRAVRRAGGVVWFDFRTLCGGPRSQNDYLEIASRFHTVLLSCRVPADAARRAASPGWSTDEAASPRSPGWWSSRALRPARVEADLNMAGRFSAAVPADAALRPKGPLAHEFPRTVRRGAAAGDAVGRVPPRWRRATSTPGALGWAT